jgi:hypothetical protein
MNLLDHFHGPLEGLWAGVHNAWMTFLANAVTHRLPQPYMAVSSSSFGIEVDVAAVDRMTEAGTIGDWRPDWQPPPPNATVPFAIATDEMEIRVFTNQSRDMELVGAVEFVSPANEDRDESRDGFVSKCHDYLQNGIGLVIVDVVTSRRVSLHNDLMTRLGHPQEARPGHLYVSAYRPLGANGDGTLDVWHYPLAVGRPLPTVPFCLRGGISVPAELAETYADACRFTNMDRAMQRLRPLPAQQPQ